MSCYATWFIKTAFFSSSYKVNSLLTSRVFVLPQLSSVFVINVTNIVKVKEKKKEDLRM